MSVNIITLTQDYPTAGTLKVTQVRSPETFTLYVFLYSDWIVGNQSSIYAKGQTGLNPDGTWQDPICVLSGVYNAVVTNGTTTCVIASHLSI
jgi:hypothetical protein